MSDEEHLDSELDDELNSIDGNNGGDSEDSLASGDAASALLTKQKERAKLQSDIEAFLANGGKITMVDVDIVNDPPKKPESHYGSQPI